MTQQTTTARYHARLAIAILDGTVRQSATVQAEEALLRTLTLTSTRS